MPAKQELDVLSAFLGNLLSGTADLSLKALPILKVYKRAQDERVDFWEILLTDEETSQLMIKALQKHAEKLSPRVIAALKLLINTRQEFDVRKKQEAETMAKARTAQPVHSRTLDADV